MLTTDYLIIGSGAAGMSFADQLLTETNANIVIVDRHHLPGGHWNDAYPFVRLHGPSAFYGVGSRQLATTASMYPAQTKATMNWPPARRS